MPVHEFEKEVQRTMEELELNPSAEVWIEVEKRIRREKRRRRIIFWWFFPLLLAGGMALFFLNRTRRTEHITGPVQPGHPAENGPATPGNKYGIPANKPDDTETSAGHKEQVLPAQSSTPGSKPAVRGDRYMTGPSVVLSHRPGQIKKERNQAKKTDTTAADDNDRIPDPLADPVKVVQPDQKDPYPLFPTIAAPPVQVDDKRSAVPATGTDQVAKDSITGFVANKDAAATDSLQQEDRKKIRITQKYRWETGIVTGIGISNRKDPFLTGSANKSARVGASQSSGGGGGGMVIIPSSGSLRNGLFWEGGVYARKKLSVRTAFSTGLEVAAFGTRQETDGYRNIASVFYDNANRRISVNGIYLTGNREVYRNNYMIAAAPLSFEWQLNKAGRKEWIWTNGFTPGLLAASRAIVFNPSPGFYYTDKKAYHRFQLFYHTGLSARFAAHSKHPFTAGLQLQYGLTGLHKNSSTERNNLLSVGLQFRYTLKK